MYIFIAIKFCTLRKILRFQFISKVFEDFAHLSSLKLFTCICSWRREFPFSNQVFCLSQPYQIELDFWWRIYFILLSCFQSIKLCGFLILHGSFNFILSLDKQDTSNHSSDFSMNSFCSDLILFLVEQIYAVLF